jgi:hypothetical protein
MATVLCVAGDRSAADLNESYRSKHSSTGISQLLAVAQMQVHTDPSSKAAAAAALASVDLASMSQHSVVDCEAAFRWLRDDMQQAEAAATFFDSAQKVHRWSSVFEGPERDQAFADSVDALVKQIDALQTA